MPKVRKPHDIARPMTIICPKCLKPAPMKQTQYGIRHQCCGLWSWGGKPLVPATVHAARQQFNAAFDRLWKTAETVYDIRELPGSYQYDRVVKKIRRTARNRAYAWLSHVSHVPEPECHGAEQTNLRTLHHLVKWALTCSGPAEVRDWAIAKRAIHANHGSTGGAGSRDTDDIRSGR